MVNNMLIGWMNLGAQTAIGRSYMAWSLHDGTET